MSSATTTVPIACTLIPDAFMDRVGWIKELTATSLREHRRDGLALHLIYDPGAAAQVRELVRQERECCGFLRFDLREDADTVRLTIIAPPEAREAAGELFDHFVRQAGQPAAAAGT
jgi:small multidrug resistance family-3 protein